MTKINAQPTALTINGGDTINGNPIPSFVGILDGLSNIVGAYSVRRLRVAYTGALIRLRRSSDNAESDFGFLADGSLDAAAVSVWLGGGNGYATTWYDQSGNGRNLVQATADNQPLYVASGPNSKPTLRFDGTNDRLKTATWTAIALPQHIFTVLKQVAWVDGRYIFDGGITNAMGLLQTGGSGRVKLFTGPLSDNAVDFGTTLYNVGTFLYRTSGGQAYLRKNGVTTLGGFGQGNNNTGITLGCRGDGTASFSNVEFSEFAMFSATQTETAIEASMKAYYGTP